jgi:hypothetical protein
MVGRGQRGCTGHLAGRSFAGTGRLRPLQDFEDNAGLMEWNRVL